MANGEQKEKKKMKLVTKIMLVLLLTCIFVAAVIYVGGAFYYSNRFLNGTNINGIDCSNLNAGEVKELLQEQVLEYELTLKFLEGKTEVITGNDLGMVYEDNGEVDSLLSAQNRWEWIFSFMKEEVFQVSSDRTYKENVVDILLWEMEYFREENQVGPQDAYLKDSGTYYEIVPEVMGNTLNLEHSKELVVRAIDEGKSEVDFVKEDCYEKPEIYQDDENLNADLEQLNFLLGTKITYDFDDRQEVVDATVVKEWIYKAEDGTWKVDREKAETFVQNLKNKYDTFGKTREFKTSLGNTVTVKGGDYGWVIKKAATTDALVAAISEAKVATMEPVYLYKGTCRATNDIGGTYIEVSIEHQRMWCYKDGQLIVDTPVVTGTANVENRETPSGSVWAIDGKVSPWVLRGEDYATKVTFWLPFNGNVGVHDATWRSAFGGDIYLTDGSHGCINTPYENAEKIYNAVGIGHPVIVY